MADKPAKKTRSSATQPRASAAKPRARAKQAAPAPPQSAKAPEVPPPAPTITSSKQTEQLREVLVEAARAEMAAMTAAVKFWGGWVEAADRYVQAVSGELSKMSEATEDTGELVGRLGDLTRAYLQSLADLPNMAVQTFNREIDKVARPMAKRVRAVRVKD
jgi:hypothetical protein